MDFFTNFGVYRPRTHCVVDAAGEPDWLWIVGMVVLTGGVVAGYLLIVRVWMQCYFAEQVRDRNRKLLDLAAIFVLCALCGYVMNVVMFVWPAYRLTALALIALNVFTWRFALKPDSFKAAFAAGRVQRELAEQLRAQNENLERTIADRTAALERATAEAGQASAFKSQFIANVSHELRTPMTSILGFAHLLNDPTLTSRERDEHLHAVTRNGEHLLTIINDVLDLSKIEAGQLSVEKIEFSTSSALMEVVDLLRTRAADRGIGLTMTFTTPIPRTVVGDPTRVRQVLINLVGNALKFTEQGSVRIEASYEAGPNGGGGELLVAVLDTGIGMSPEQMALLFRPFGQADATTTRRFGGTGLGLSISRRLCELMGGTIGVQSTIGVGSRFTLRLPVNIAAPEMIDSPEGANAANPSRSAVPQLGPAKVLLVEDGVDNQRLISLYLRKAGLTVAIAENGRDGFEKLRLAHERGTPYDLVLMDMQMPVMDGLTATGLIRTHGYTTPVIALTANSMAGDRERFIGGGCDDYLSKPVDLAAFYASLARSLKKSDGPVERTIRHRVDAA
jgi:signal transduction histidine kinase/ActR/RegA family two-component response regulator